MKTFALKVVKVMHRPHRRCNDPAFTGTGDHDGVFTIEIPERGNTFLLEATKDHVLREVAVSDQTDGKARGGFEHAWVSACRRKRWQGYCPGLP